MDEVMKKLALIAAVILPMQLSANEVIPKEEFFDAVVKLKACTDAGYFDDSTVQGHLTPKVMLYGKTNLTQSEIDNFNAKLQLKVNQTSTVMGWGCEDAFDTLNALPESY